MFDIGFPELATIVVVALLVVGPQRLPNLARSAGLWFGRARRYVLSVKAEIDRELYIEEARRLQKRAESSSLHEIIEETVSDIKQSVSTEESQSDDSENGKRG